MIKNKLKFVIYIFSFVLFFMFFNNKVNALDYDVNINSIEGLVYGNKLNSAKINGESTIDGHFSFYDGNILLNNVGNISVEVVFIPSDLDNYEVKRVNVNSFIEKRKIEVVFSGFIYKQYDGSDKINLPEYRYDGIIDEEVSVIGDLVATLEGIYVGEDIPVILSGVEIIGEKKEFYQLELSGHRGNVYPLMLEKEGYNATQITLDKNVYVDTRYSLIINVNENVNTINDKYSTFKEIEYLVYNHNNIKLDIQGNFKVSMNASDEDVNRNRFTLFELTKEGEYKKIEYVYNNGKLEFNIASTSRIVFATRDIEYNLIYLFNAVLLFCLCFVIVSRIKNSKMKEDIIY